MKKCIKSILMILCMAAVLFAVVFYLNCHSVTKRNIEIYQKYTSSGQTLMPKLDSLAKYEDLEFKQYMKKEFIFESNSYTLVVKYPEDTYKREKRKLNKTYEFKKDFVGERHYDDLDIPAKNPNFTVGTFNFRLLSFEKYKEAYDLNYPQNMIFIGTSDKTCEIAYIEFDDNDLDYIDRTFEDFLREECGWK